MGPHGRNLGSPTRQCQKDLDYDNNDIAMCLSGFYQEGRMKIDNPEFFESGDWMVVHFTVFKDAVQDVACAYYGHYLMVNSSIPKSKQKIAWQFIKYMLDHPLEYLTEVNIIQPRKDLIESELFKSLPYTDIFMADMAG